MYLLADTSSFIYSEIVAYRIVMDRHRFEGTKMDSMFFTSLAIAGDNCKRTTGVTRFAVHGFYRPVCKTR